MGHRMKSNASVAVIGCGYWGKNLVRNLHELGALRIVCDEHISGRERAATLAPGAKILHRSEDLDKWPVDGIVIATPAATHYALTKQALVAGKDVFCEKPLSLTYEQGYELVRLASAAKRILMVGHVLEYNPGVVKLIEMVRAGELGQINYVYSNRLSLGKIRQVENILWSFAPHDLAIILRLVGSMPFQVSACGGSYLQPNIADITVTNLLFDNGVRAHVFVSWLHPFKEQRLVVIGSSKMASFDDVSKKLILHDQRIDLKSEQPVPIQGEGILVPFSDREPLRIECEAFLQAVSSRELPLTDGVSGLRVLQVLQAAQRSLVMNGEPIHLPLEFHS